MPTILAIAGSPSRTSRTAAVLELVAGRLALDGHTVRVRSVRDLPADALLGADPDHPAIAAVAAEVAECAGLIVATPVYKAAYSGLLKSLLDLLPQYAFAGKAVLPLATGGTLAHVLALDYALRPVLTAMGARHVVGGYFLHDQALASTPDGGVTVEAGAQAALDRAVDAFTLALDGPLRSAVPAAS